MSVDDFLTFILGDALSAYAGQTDQELAALARDRGEEV